MPSKLKPVASVFKDAGTLSKDEAWLLFSAGFMAPDHVWNGEYPLEDRPLSDLTHLYSQFEHWFSEHISR